MASGTDYAQEYQQAEKAYMQGRYEEAAAIVDRLVEEYAKDPSARLLRGHIYCYGLQQYEVAREQYEAVLELTSDPDFVDYANTGLEYTKQFSESDSSLDNSQSAGFANASDGGFFRKLCRGFRAGKRQCFLWRAANLFSGLSVSWHTVGKW
jgi:twitching motility protein PilJ